MTLTEFLLARIAEDEADADKDEVMDRGFHSGTCGLLWVADYLEPECTCAMRTRMLVECEVKRRIVELHRSWPVLAKQQPTVVTYDDVASMTVKVQQQLVWLTEQEYRTKFGDEPPTAPMLAALATVYADHPDYREEWRP